MVHWERIPLTCSGEPVRTCCHGTKGDAFRNGKVFSVAVANTEKWTRNTSYEFIGYVKGILAGLAIDENHIRLKCLVTGKSQTLASPDGSRIEYLLLDGCSLVAITLSENCYVWRLFRGVQRIELLEPTSFGLNSIFIMGVVVSDSRLAIFYEEEQAEKIHLTTMDTTTRTRHDFEFGVKTPHFTELEDFKVMNTPGGKSVVFFERVPGSPTCVYFTRITPNGIVESQGHVEHPNIEGYTSHSERTSAVLQLDECVTLWSYLRHLSSPLSDGPDTWLLLRICYVQDHLEVKEQTIKHNGKTPPGVATELFWWKDVVYMANHLDEQGKLEVRDLRESTCKPTGMSLLKPPRKHGNSLPPDIATSPWLLLGDETFLISVRRDSCVVWCFDRHLAQAIPFEDKGLYY